MRDGAAAAALRGRGSPAAAWWRDVRAKMGGVAGSWCRSSFCMRPQAALGGGLGVVLAVVAGTALCTVALVMMLMGSMSSGVQGIRVPSSSSSFISSQRAGPAAGAALAPPGPAGGQHFLLVHGIGGGAWFFHELVAYLEAADFVTTALDLASNGVHKAVADDVATVQEYTRPLLRALASVKGQVILVGHSMGGGSITYAMERYPAKIAKAVFLCSIMPHNGQSFFSSFPPTVFPRLLREKNLYLQYAKGSPSPTSVAANKTRLVLFAFNQSPQQYVTLGKQLFTATPYRPGEVTLNLTKARYGSIRRFYIRTGHDHAIFPEEQDEIIAANPPERVFHLPRADHMAFLSTPVELFAILTRISTL